MAVALRGRGGARGICVRLCEEGGRSPAARDLKVMPRLFSGGDPLAMEARTLNL